MLKTQTYENMKDSGVDWLIQIPNHWNEEKLKYISRVDNSGDFGLEPEVGDLQYPVATTAQISSDGEFHVTKMPIRSFFSREAARYLCKAGDILVVKSSGSNANVISGKAGIVDKETPKFIFSNFLLRLEPYSDITNARFVYYLISSHLTRERVKRMVAGSTYPNLRVGEYVSALLPIPPLPEQTAIADFLDRKTRQIDEVVVIKQKQIELLKERKQILIQNAVTQGLYPNAPMRDSGVEWIGKIPKHWEVKRAKYLFDEVDERSVTGLEELLSVSHMTGVTPRSEKTVSMFMAEDYSGSKTCKKDDLVFNIMWAWMGALGVADRMGIVSSSYGIFRQQKVRIFDSKYLEWLLKTTGYIEHYNKVSTGLHSSRLRFYSHMFFDMELGYPPKEEQTAIVAHIEKESTKIDQAIDLNQQQIEKLKEYKATLINSAVTGKIKVV